MLELLFHLTVISFDSSIDSFVKEMLDGIDIYILIVGWIIPDQKENGKFLFELFLFINDPFEGIVRIVLKPEQH